MTTYNAGDKVRIVKANESTYWYANRIGEIFTLVRQRKAFCNPSKWDIAENPSGVVDEDDVELVEPQHNVLFVIDVARFARDYEMRMADAWVSIQNRLFKLGYWWPHQNQRIVEYSDVSYAHDTPLLANPSNGTIIYSHSTYEQCVRDVNTSKLYQVFPKGTPDNASYRMTHANGVELLRIFLNPKTSGERERTIAIAAGSYTLKQLLDYAKQLVDNT